GAAGVDQIAKRAAPDRRAGIVRAMDGAAPLAGEATAGDRLEPKHAATHAAIGKLYDHRGGGPSVRIPRPWRGAATSEGTPARASGQRESPGAARFAVRRAPLLRLLRHYENAQTIRGRFSDVDGATRTRRTSCPPRASSRSGWWAR